jgi:uncharacterized repeat protein (TIGR03803 family)
MSVYFTTDGIGANGNGALMKVPIAGGAAITLAEPGEPHTPPPRPLAVDGTSVYWMNFGGATGARSVMKVPVPLTGGAPTTYPFGASYVVADDTSVYWAGGSPPGTTTIVKASLGGGVATTLAAGPFDQVTGLAVDATSVYWTTYERDADGGVTGRVLKLTPK